MDVQPPKSDAGIAPTYASVAASAVKEMADLTAMLSGGKNGSSDSLTTKHSPSNERRPNMPRQRSRGQIARRNSITRGSSDVRSSLKRRKNDDVSSSSKTATMTATTNERARSDHRVRFLDNRANVQSSRGPGGGGEQPWLGGLYFTDIVFIAFTYSVNLLRTLGLAELADVIVKGLIYASTQLPFDLYRRWSLSTPPRLAAPTTYRRNAAKIKRRRRRQRRARRTHATSGSSSDSDPFEVLSQQPAVFTSSTENQPESNTVDSLSPFHHLVILLSRFACVNFPHLLPRVLFAEETIGPFVYWRTGGGSNSMVQEFTDLNERRTPLLKGHQAEYSRQSSSTSSLDDGSFRAYLLSKDARMPIDVQRSNIASRRATTLLYLHGGGFSLGSVAFYAEALLRVRAKIALLESKGSKNFADRVAEARCVAVEYDLSPSARFPLPLLQCLRCYAHLIEVEQIDPESICLAGDSAGGNLAMAMLLCLDGQMRDEQALAERDWSALPMPGKAVLISPWVDLRPSKAHAFSDLRKTEIVNSNASAEKAEQTTDNSAERIASEWTAAVGKHDWDFVASEALLHFAQLYTGVLPVPRRVQGPLGWVSHVCGVLAIRCGEDEAESPRKTKGFMDPSRALSAFSRPSRQLAKVTYDALNDPLLPRLLGLSLEGTAVSEDSASQVVARSDSLTAGFEPLFTPSDRRTDLVPSKRQLYEPAEGPLSSTGADKIGVDREATHVRLRGRELLESHPLISPTIGDWSRIKLKKGCLVTWGERERMAADIEAWVDSVVNNDAVETMPTTDAPPAPDGLFQTNEVKSVGIATADQTTIRDTEQSGEANEWIYTAVEKGPGGVHAWPYVSMYLAGTEGERERGLDLLARFIARTELDGDDDDDVEFEHVVTDTDDARPPAGAAKINIDAALSQSSVNIDPPHAAPYSSDEDDADSVGSMPSDVDLHGLVDNPNHYNPYATGIDIVEAVRKAQELGFVETETGTDPSDEEDVNASTQHSAQLTPRPLVARPTHIVARTPPPLQPLPPVPRSPQRTRGGEAEPERGRSRSPRKAVHLVSPTTTKHTVDASHFVSGVPLHVPQHVQLFSPAAQQAQQVLSSPQTRRPQGATPLWWTGSHAGTQTTPADVEKEETKKDERPSDVVATSSDAPQTLSVAIPLPSLNDDDDAESREPRKGKDVAQEPDEEESPLDGRRDDSRHTLEDIAEGSSEDAMSPARSLSPEEPQEYLAQPILINTDPGYHALSRWAIRRPEPEGLSDIAEEGSVLSASVTSAGGDEDRSRSLSPVGFRRAGPGGDNGGGGGVIGTPSLAEAAMQFMQGHTSSAAGSPTVSAPSTVAASGPETPRQWRYLRDELGIRPRRADQDDDDDDDDDDLADIATLGGLAFSPPAKPQPGRSLPVTAHAQARASSSSDVSADADSADASPSGAIGIQRKKPKGDVWW